MSMHAMGQQLDVNINGEDISVEIIDHASKLKLIDELDGQVNTNLFKPWTKHTMQLTDGSLLVEFYDRQAVRVKDENDLIKLAPVRFVKNYIYFLKKNISYKYPVDISQDLTKYNRAKKLSNQSDNPYAYTYEIWELEGGDILFILDVQGQKTTTVYNDIKTLASDINATLNAESEELLAQNYGGMEEWSQKLIFGDPLLDFEPNEHLIYPEYLAPLIQNHALVLQSSNIYVDMFRSDLYRSDRGYFVLVHDPNQVDVTGDKMSILTARLYENQAQLDRAISQYEVSSRKGFESEHFFQKISEQFGADYPQKADSLIYLLPQILNFNTTDLTFDEEGMLVVDEAIRWNHIYEDRFDSWFPSVLAFYGKCYSSLREPARWSTKFVREHGVHIPTLLDDAGDAIFDPNEFYKSLNEWPIPMRWAGRMDKTK